MGLLLTLNILVLQGIYHQKLGDEAERNILTAIWAEFQCPTDFGMKYVLDDVMFHL